MIIINIKYNEYVEIILYNPKNGYYSNFFANNHDDIIYIDCNDLGLLDINSYFQLAAEELIPFAKRFNLGYKIIVHKKTKLTKNDKNELSAIAVSNKLLK